MTKQEREGWSPKTLKGQSYNAHPAMKSESKSLTQLTKKQLFPKWHKQWLRLIWLGNKMM